METKKIGVVVGSLRKESFSRKIANALKELAPESLELVDVPIGGLEIFNQDLDDEGKTPKSWKDFRDSIRKFDGFLFVTPEYNRSFPPVLKNALDIGSRPYGQNAWDGKPAAVVSVTPGSLGAFGANHHLRQVLTFLNILTMAQPEAYISNAAALFDDNGRLKGDNTRGFLRSFMNAFASWVETISPAKL